MSGGVPQEVVVNNTLTTGQSYSLPGSISGTATKIQVWMSGHPDDLRSNILVGESDWQEGLTIATEDCLTTTSSCSNRVRWSWTDWTQDIYGGSVPEHLANPRVIETRVGDGTNTKRTTTSYHEHPLGMEDHVAYFGLPSEIKIYDGSTVLKRTTIEYNNAYDLVTRRIIGLPSKVELYSPTSTLMSKVTFGYDEDGYSTEQTVEPAVGHDNDNYGKNMPDRGNRTSTTRWNVDYPTSSTAAVTTTAKYNTAGSLMSRTDPMGRTTRIGYSDNFNSSGNPTTYAYPTVITTFAGSSLGDSAYSTTTKYRYDIGASVETTGPPPTGQTYGKKTVNVFDSYGRPEKRSTFINSSEQAYTRYEYPSNGIQSKIYSTIIDAGGDGPGTADEVLTETWTDGAGRVRGSRTEHPGSTGGWSASRVEYDVLGRAKRQTVPTEVSVSSPNDPDHWTPSGDDDRGSGVWLWTHQKYDWMGRVIRKISTDGVDSTTPNDSDILISYDGCGCAGGLVTTIDGENIIETDWDGNNPTTLGRRRQKVHQDILGRPWKTEVMQWNGTTVYSTKVDVFNGRDQITSTTTYAGTTSGASRTVTMEYDGHGRMKLRKYPIENTGTATTWTYNDDDTINKVTDPRGVETNFSYYSATGLLDTIAYTVPSGQASSVPDTPDVTFTYDNLGNRTSMTDGTGSSTYSYNSLSQMTQETKTFTGLTGDFTINYTYNASGGLRSMSDPHDPSREVVFGHDKIGRVVGANMEYQSSSTAWVHDAEYRAWGDLKRLEYNLPNTNVFSVDLEYDERLKLNGYENKGVNTSSVLLSLDFRRFADGNLKFAETSGPNTGDRSYRYDHIGRLTKGYSGKDAHDGSTSVMDGPYKQDFTYNSFSDITNMTGKQWGLNVGIGYSKSYDANGRDALTGYDAAGNIISDRIRTIWPQPVLDRTMKYDAAGRQVETFDPAVHTCCEVDQTYSTSYDGNGWKVKTRTQSSADDRTTYEVRSTVLGGELVGTLRPFTQHPQKAFIAPVLGGKLNYLNIVDHSEFTYYTRETPEGFEYDARGALVPDEPVSGGGGYPAGGVDPSVYTRCAEGGVPQSCDAQARFDKAFKRISDLVERDLDKERESSNPKSGPGTSMAQESRRTDYAGRATTQTIKPDASLEVGSMLEISSLPCVESEFTVCEWTFRRPGFVEGRVVNDGFPGGWPNPIAQLAPCPELEVPTFDELEEINPAALNLLLKSFGEANLPKATYNRLSTYEKAVFLNTVAGASTAGVNLSEARFQEFYRSDKPGELPFGIRVTGASGLLDGRKKGSGGVEIRTDSEGVSTIDIDLFNPLSGPIAFFKHQNEIDFNIRHNRPTHPGDVTRQLKKRGVVSGVKCKEKK